MLFPPHQKHIPIDDTVAVQSPITLRVEMLGRAQAVRKQQEAGTAWFAQFRTCPVKETVYSVGERESIANKLSTVLPALSDRVAISCAPEKDDDVSALCASSGFDTRITVTVRESACAAADGVGAAGPPPLQGVISSSAHGRVALTHSSLGRLRPGGCGMPEGRSRGCPATAAVHTAGHAGKTTRTACATSQASTTRFI